MAQLIDVSGVKRFEGTITGAGGLPPGWAIDGNVPAELFSNGGALDLGGGFLQVGVTPGQSASVAAGTISLSDTTPDTAIFLDPTNAGVFVRPPATLPALTVANDHAPPGCIDPGGVPLVVPGSRPQVPHVPTAQDVVDALVTLGLVTQA